MSAPQAGELLQALWPVGVAVVALGAAVASHALSWRLFRRVAKKTETSADDAIEHQVRRPTLALLLALVTQALRPSLVPALPPAAQALLTRGLHILTIAAVAWVAVRLAAALEDLLLTRARAQHADSLTGRGLVTQVRIITKVVTFLVVVVALGAVLMTYDEVRQLGTGLLASAGIAGLIIGLAAQRTIANLIAGIQIALTQPIRIDDVVVVEGEWGWIEDVTLTYVVVRIWDERRLILPIAYFLEKPFQNWTRRSSELLGTVFLYADYGVDVPALRRELERIARASSLWDGRVARVQVTDSKPQVLEVRALVSAADSGKLWDLRCEVREQLVAYLQREQHSTLPVVRTELVGGLVPRPASESAAPADPAR